MNSGKVSGISGSVLGVMNGFRGSTKWAHHTPSGSHGPEGGAPAPGGLGGQPKKAYAAGLVGKGKSKWGREGVLLGVGLEVDSSTSTSFGRHLGGSLGRPAPPLPPIYTRGFFRAALTLISHVLPTSSSRSFSPLV